MILSNLTKRCLHKKQNYLVHENPLDMYLHIVQMLNNIPVSLRLSE